MSQVKTVGIEESDVCIGFPERGGEDTSLYLERAPDSPILAGGPSTSRQDQRCKIARQLHGASIGSLISPEWGPCRHRGAIKLLSALGFLNPLLG